MDSKNLFIGTIIRIFTAKLIHQGTYLYELLSPSLQGVRRLFVLAYITAANAANNVAGVKGNKKRFLQQGKD